MAEPLPDPASADKVALRVRMRGLRAGLAPEVRAAAAARLCAHLTQAAAYVGARQLAAYVALGDEVDPAAIVAAAHRAGSELALPRVEGPGRMSLRRYRAGDPLVAGRFGLREPSADAPAVHPAAVELFLLPGLAFDDAGGRLGYGGGFYDRLLPLAPDATRIGLLYECQRVARVPTGPHDVRMHMLASERGLSRCVY